MTESPGRGKHPALTDSPTGLPNKLHFDTVFNVSFAAGRRGIPLTLILLEVDQHVDWASGRGRAEVDRAMRALGETLAAALRQTDLLARLEVARFAMVMLDCNLAGGHLVSDRVVGLLERFRGQTGLTCSLGVAAYLREMERPYDLLEAAERALRAAQARGGNQVQLAG
jgi:diguanylate cyclase (GGDEF)-like protein